MADLFDRERGKSCERGPRFARPRAACREGLLAAIDRSRRKPLPRMTTPGGFQMSVAMTNCARRLGHRSHGLPLHPRDPEAAHRGRDARRLPALARDAADEAGFAGFVPDACLINRYAPGARLSLHQDKDERDYGLPSCRSRSACRPSSCSAGSKRNDQPEGAAAARRCRDLGRSRPLRYHGVLALKEGEHPVLGRRRFNLTFQERSSKGAAVFGRI